jgi:hypothetical protein
MLPSKPDPEVRMLKDKKERKKKPAKLHIEVTQANWERLKAYIDAYNASEARVTPKIKPAHAINQALVEFLSEREA